MKTPQVKLSRRKFLLAATAGSAATAVAVVAGRDASSDPSSEKKQGTGAHKGYQVTEHVLNYYRTAKI
jgi:hypothetical protein